MTARPRGRITWVATARSWTVGLLAGVMVALGATGCSSHLSRAELEASNRSAAFEIARAAGPTAPPAQSQSAGPAAGAAPNTPTGSGTAGAGVGQSAHSGAGANPAGAGNAATSVAGGRP